MPSQFSLIVSIPGEDPTKFDLDGERVSFGRSPENDIQILVAEVSVKHGELVLSDDGCRIVDNGSTNGTKVNGTRIATEGVQLSPMDKVLLGETVPAYFVPTAVLESASIAELVNSIEAAPKEQPRTETAPVAVAVPVKPGAPAAAIPSGGAQTVRLDQVKPTAGGAVRPPVAAPKPPGPVAPGAPKAAPVAPGGLKPPAAAPRPAVPATPGAPKPAIPAGPGGAPKPGVPMPAGGAGVKPPSVSVPGAPKTPPPGGPPTAPKPVPLKRPAPGGAKEDSDE